MNGDLISRSALVEYCQRLAIDEWNNKTAPTSWAYAYGEFADMVEAAPAVDAVQVVRCKGCKCGKYPGSTRLVGKYVCCALYDPMPLMRSDDFCSYGERRDDDAD